MNRGKHAVSPQISEMSDKGSVKAEVTGRNRYLVQVTECSHAHQSHRMRSLSVTVIMTCGKNGNWLARCEQCPEIVWCSHDPDTAISQTVKDLENEVRSILGLTVHIDYEVRWVSESK